MKLASIEPILSVDHHPNADRLDLAQIGGYKAIVPRDQWKVGDLAVFIAPDSLLPDALWAAPYKKRSSRVRAIKLRGIFSFGIIESAANVGYTGPMEAGLDVTEALGILKYDPPTPQDLNVAGPFGLGIPKTDQSNWQSLDSIPYGELVDVTLKIDGQSASFFWTIDPVTGEEIRGTGGRSFVYKPDSQNNYTQNQANHDVLNRLSAYCRKHGIVSGLCLRGEQYGHGIQKGAHNPHSKLPLGLALFSTWIIGEFQYAHKGHPLYIYDLAPQLGLPTVPLLEKDVPLTPALIKRYSEELETISVNGGPPQGFEGVVIGHKNGSFKVINLHFDSKK